MPFRTRSASALTASVLCYGQQEQGKYALPSPFSVRDARRLTHDSRATAAPVDSARTWEVIWCLCVFQSSSLTIRASVLAGRHLFELLEPSNTQESMKTASLAEVFCFFWGLYQQDLKR